MDIVSAASFVDYLESIRRRTRNVVLVIPPAQLEWRAAPGRFSPGDLVRHLAGTERYLWAETVRGRPSAYPGHGRELADGFDAVLAYFDRLHAEAVTIFRNLSADDLRGGTTTPAGVTMPTWKWLRAMVEHEVHHRGQLYEMLGTMGVATPPIFGLTEQQVRDAAGTR